MSDKKNSTTKKSKHQQIIEIVDQVSSISEKLGIAHQTIEDGYLDGRIIHIDGQRLTNFGSCSYMGLELDPRLKAGAIDAVNRYGSQFASSRAYLSVTLYTEIEELLERIFEQKIILGPTVTLGHQSNIPVLVEDNDVVIMDSQVHESVQAAVQLLKLRNIAVHTVKHNDVNALETKIKSLKDKYNKIWYMADGVYSMYGDFAPMDELKTLMDTYPQFYCYLDDAHGMGWTGRHGAGYVKSKVWSHPQMILITSIAKSFAACGGVTCYPEEEMRRIVKNCGGTMIFSGPIQPPVLGAAIASAKIHLSDEVFVRQSELKKKIKYFNTTAKLYDLPLVHESLSPIFFIGVGKPEVGYNMVKRLMKLGYYLNLAVFPAVPYKNTGLRIPITMHHTYEDIESLLKTIAEQLPKALAESNSNIDEVIGAFQMEQMYKLPE
ncbi:MAG: aminotransferase class I/II-fold pyridoxal phosphate-dependent enzyme [Bacteroidia bacterium]|nr:aminotransferase class I/II-fold pyridoxal phosphate-dependent enzyme [Bacteroidia bacterium]